MRRCPLTARLVLVRRLAIGLRIFGTTEKHVDDEAISLVHAFVTSRLDYCNSLYANSSVSTRQRLQRASSLVSSNLGLTSLFSTNMAISETNGHSL